MLARAGEGFAIRTARAGAGMTWTKERIELLTKLWTEGLSASQIAAELGGDVSRNSVLGKANRLGLTHGPAKASSAPRPCKPPPPKPPLTGEPSSHDGSTLASMPTHPVAANQPAVVPPSPVLLREAAIVPRSEGVMLLELREFMCRWPLGDPTTPEFRYCGTQALMGLPYCPHHAQIAYQPAAERKRLGSVRARATAPGRRGFAWM
jgi:GcrA cell cycle regulator